MNKINTLVFEGGGTYGLAYSGALKELQKRIDFNNIQYVCGTSVGALIAFAIASGLKPEHVEDVVSKFRIAILLRTPGILLRMPWNAIVNYGLINSNIVKDICLLVLRTIRPRQAGYHIHGTTTRCDYHGDESHGLLFLRRFEKDHA